MLSALWKHAWERELTTLRILCLKLDHIGDLLIAAPALMLLRQSFSNAHITLLCAPWNVQLAKRLGIADEVHAIAFFSQSSLADLDGSLAEARRRDVAAKLQELDLAPFDLAVDLRRDEDTRDVLKMVDARYYAGFGDLAAFSFLDIALPFTRHGPAAGATQLRLEPQDLNTSGGHELSEHGLHLTASIGRIELSIATDAAWSPSEGGGDDFRTLGVALWRINLRNQAEPGTFGPPLEVSRDAIQVGPGWLNWEPWGRWTNAAEAFLSIGFEAVGEQTKLLVAVQGHTSSSHPEARVRVSALSDGAIAEHCFRAGDEAHTLELTCRPIMLAPTARSSPVLVRGGRYAGVLRLHVADVAKWRPVKLRVRTAQLGQILAELVLPATLQDSGLLEFPFELEVRDSAEPLIVEIASEEIDHDRNFAVVGVDLDWLQGGYPKMPLVHMEQQLLDLAAMIALRHAPKLIAPNDEVRERLTAPRGDSSAKAAVAHLLARRGRRRFFGSRTKRHLIGMGIGANKETKLWPREYFIELCRRLLDRPDVDLVFIGGPNERDEVDALRAALGAGDRAIDFCAACKIEDLGEILAELDGFVGLDTGTTHFAGRVGLRTFALFGAAHDPREWGPVGARSGWASVDLPCGSCSLSGRDQCLMALVCMTSMTPDVVWPLVQDWLFDEAAPA